jgi:guanylate kinase
MQHTPTPELSPTGHRRGFMFVLSSPSGAGKTTLSRRLLASHAGLTLSISVTTRPKRPGEIDRQDYYFIDRETFGGMVVQGELLEHATVFEHQYGTPAHLVEQALAQGIDVLFDIDWQGTRQLAQHHRADLVSIFILPPSMAELERRLIQRGQDSEEVVAYRMKKAKSEISHWQEYDYVVVNHDLDLALAKIMHILEAERLRRTRQTNLPLFVDALCAQIVE